MTSPEYFTLAQDKMLEKQGSNCEHFMFCFVMCSVAQSCPTLCNSNDGSPLGPSVMEIFRQEYWSRLPFLTSGDLPKQPRDWTQVSFISCIGRWILYHRASYSLYLSNLRAFPGWEKEKRQRLFFIFWKY